MILKAHQIALLGAGEDQVLIGLRSFPAHKLTLLSNGEFLEQANHLAGNLGETLRLVVDVKLLKDATIPAVLELWDKYFEPIRTTFRTSSSMLVRRIGI